MAGDGQRPRAWRRPGLGFRVEAAIPADGLSVLNLIEPGSMPAPPLYPYMSEHARELLAEAGWSPEDEDGYDFSGGPIGH